VVGDRAQNKATDGKAVGTVISVGGVDIGGIYVEVAGVGGARGNR